MLNLKDIFNKKPKRQEMIDKTFSEEQLSKIKRAEKFDILKARKIKFHATMTDKEIIQEILLSNPIYSEEPVIHIDNGIKIKPIEKAPDKLPDLPKFEDKKPIFEEKVVYENKVILELNEGDIPTLKKIIGIASAGIPTSDIMILLQKIKDKIK